jgi:hypothetical protein
MPSIRSLTVGKEALKKLSNAAIDYDVRPHELVDAIVVHTNWETRVEDLVKIIKDSREKGVESLSGGFSGPESSPESSLTRSRVLSSPSRVPVESESSPEKTEKTAKKTRLDPSRVRVESVESSEGPKT